jgi:hypothetical protein
VTVRVNTKTSPTTRSLAYLRAHGWTCDIAERRQGPITRDLFGAFDIVGFKPGGRSIVVQTTSHQHFSERLCKVLACPHLSDLMHCGVEVWVHGWRREEVEPRTERVEVRAVTP